MTKQEFISKTLRQFWRQYGDLPVYMDHTKPNAQTWEETDYMRSAYIMDNVQNTVIYGHFLSPYCFVQLDIWDLREMEKMYDSHKIDTSMINESVLQAYQDRQWAYFNSVDFENFQNNTEIIYEGIIELCQYYPDNTLKTRILIDEQTGELLYEANYVMGQYEDPDTNKMRSYLKYMDRYQNGKFIAANRKKIDGRPKWVVISPISLKGKTLEQKT